MEGEDRIKVMYEVVDVSNAFGQPDKVVAEYLDEEEAVRWIGTTLSQSTARGKYMVRKVYRT